MTVQVGVIGAGWWGTYAHTPAIKSHPRAVLRSVQTRSLADAQRIACDFGAARAFSDVDEMLADPGLQAVVIASTPNVHYAQAKAALDRGLHVLLEKPMTITVAEARELVELADRKRLQLVISCPWHFTRHSQEAQRYIREGRLGRIKMFSVLMTNPIDKLLRGLDTQATHDSQRPYISPQPGSYSDPAIAGGGQSYCQISHAAAYIAYLGGARPAEVFARFDYDGSILDIYDTMSVKMDDGSLVSIASTGVTPTASRHYEVRVFGSQAVLSLELWRGTMELVDLDNRRIESPPLQEAEIYPAQAPVINLIDAVTGQAPNLSPGALGLAAMEVIEGACRSAESGRNIFIRETL